MKSISAAVIRKTLISSVSDFKRQVNLKKFNRVVRQINSIGETRQARICFLDLYKVHNQFSKGLIEHFAKDHAVVLLVTDKRHSAYLKRRGDKNISVFLIDVKWLPFILKWIRIPYLVTPASHLHKSSVRKDLNIVHIYHSLVSMHSVYGDDAFDAYTHFFACGSHHVNEIKEIRKFRGLPEPITFNVGYPKLDELAVLYAGKRKRRDSGKTILLAPSWHPQNILKNNCEVICGSIIELGYNLIVRPHPHMYDRDIETMQKLQELSTKYHEKLVIENPNDESFESFLLADLMICDWSGVAFEYAFATERPVVFIDAPRKSNSTELLTLDIPLFESSARSQIGLIVKDVEDLKSGIQNVFETPPEQWARRIQSVRAEHIFNFMTSAEAGSEILKAFSENAELLSPVDPMTFQQIKVFD